VDLLELAKNFGIPAAGAVGGWLTTASLYKHKVELLERDFASFKTEHLARHNAEKEELKERLSTLQSDFERADEEFKKELEKKYVELFKEIREIDDDFEKFARASNHDFAKDSELARFMEEEQRSWQAMHRTLGQIEGMLKAKRWSSRPPPGPQLSPPRPPSRNSK